jgi:putative ABC transport system permease protein
MSTIDLGELSKRVPVAKPQEEELEGQSSIEDLDMGGISIFESIGLAWSTLMANKVRTVLTALGVIIGVASVVALLAIGNGSQAAITDQITANGANLLTVRASGAAGGGNATLTTDDAAAIADTLNVPDAAGVSAESQSITTVVIGSTSKNTIVLGVTPVYLTMHNNQMLYGSFITAEQSKSNVVVLGSQATKDLFGDGVDPTGQVIRVKGINFTVIGALKAKGSSSQTFDDSGVLIPLNVAQQKISNGRVQSAGNKTALSTIIVQATNKDTVLQAKAEVEALLRSRHAVPLDGSADDFTVSNQEDLITTLTATTRTMTIYLAVIAAISLIVGGIGIMNIMLVSVRERTREIGLRKAIGARERDILTQFLIEALMLSTTGGLIGLLIGVLIAVVANETGQARALVSTQSVLLSVGFAMAVGLFFGIEPARRAAKLDPIEALRYE